MNILRKMYCCTRISVGHRLMFLCYMPAILVCISIEYKSALWWALLFFMLLVFIAMFYTLFHYKRLMNEDIINFKNDNS